MGSISDVAYVFRVEDVEVLKNKIRKFDSMVPGATFQKAMDLFNSSKKMWNEDYFLIHWEWVHWSSLNPWDGVSFWDNLICGMNIPFDYVRVDRTSVSGELYYTDTITVHKKFQLNSNIIFPDYRYSIRIQL